MRNFWISAIAGLVLIVYVSTADYTPPVPMEPVYDPFEAVWAPDIFTDCDTWEIRQSPAGIEDLWPNVDFMVLDDKEYGVNDVIRLDREGDRDFSFGFYSDGQRIWHVDVAVEAAC